MYVITTKTELYLADISLDFSTATPHWRVIDVFNKCASVFLRFIFAIYIVLKEFSQNDVIMNFKKVGAILPIFGIWSLTENFSSERRSSENRENGFSDEMHSL